MLLFKCKSNWALNFPFQIRRLKPVRAGTRPGARLSLAGGHHRPPYRHDGAGPRGAGPLPSPGARRSRSHVGHGFRAADQEDCGDDAPQGRQADPHVQRHLPQTDTGTTNHSFFFSHFLISEDYNPHFPGGQVFSIPCCTGLAFVESQGHRCTGCLWYLITFGSPPTHWKQEPKLPYNLSY